MGGIFSRKKGKDSFPELLASLTKEITSLEGQQNALHRQHRLLALFTFLSLTIYVALVGGYVFYVGVPKDLVHVGVCVGSLVLIWLLRLVLKWLFGRRANACESRLTELRAEKKDVLSRVMDEVPFKTAKELLEKYDPQSIHLRVPQAQQQQQQRQQRAAAAAAPAESTAGGVRQRRPQEGAGGRPLALGQNIQQQQQVMQQQQMLQHQQQVIADQNRRLQAQQAQLRQMASDGNARASMTAPEPLPVYELKPGDVAGPAPGPPRPQPILPRERTSVDKMVEFLVGDGPNNRYALICRKCFSHNGMALPSEFEYSTFRCAYCYELNPARKQVNLVVQDNPPPPAPAVENGNGNGDTSEQVADAAPAAPTATGMTEQPAETSDVAEVSTTNERGDVQLDDQLSGEIPPAAAEAPAAEAPAAVEEDSTQGDE
ncbi:endoplasmic reticulum junction formation protein lunapark-B-like [Sycon ciliatum]|uniref:endoplasmic reticulum junction formation protein lunapark-B-like n=1 Tax=Sycon ciliatum TaxID=27933 RepID=UPI0031F6C783